MFKDTDKLDSLLNSSRVQQMLSTPRNQWYRKYPLPKKRGGVRWISEPSPMLKSIQREVLDNLCTLSVSQHNADNTYHEVITGFVPGLSIIDNARPHVGQQVVLSIDLKDFFGSLRPEDVFIHGCQVDQNHQDILSQICWTKKGLPQGSPCSPMLANWSGRLADRMIASLASNEDIKYTRYADDLTFSGEVITETFKDAVIRLLRMFGPNVRAAHNKIHFMRRHKRQIVTGIVVNEKLSIPKERRKILRAVKHRIETRGIDSVENFNFHELMGELSFLHLTDAQKARDMIDMLLAL